MHGLIFKIFSVAIVLGVITALMFHDSNPLYSYALWRGEFVVGGGVFLIVLNNILVVFLTLFGGILFSLAEIKSYNMLPGKLYDLMDRLSYPLHFIFGVFDPRIKGLRNPMKSCYFLSVAFPVMIVLINALLLSNLLVFGVLKYNLNVSDILRLMPLVTAEFFCVIVASSRGVSFPQRNLSLYLENDTKKFRAVARKFLREKENWLTLLILSIILLVSGFYEIKMMA